MAVTNVDPSTLAANWAKNLSGATDRIKAGVQAVTTPPGQAAAAAADRWLANVTNSQALFRKNVAAVSLSDWQDAFVNKGLTRIAGGAQAAVPKFATTLGKIIQTQKSIVSSLPARGDVEANIARSAAFIRAMHGAKGSFKS